MGREYKICRADPDKKLIWKNHVEITVSKATSALMVCRRQAEKT